MQIEINVVTPNVQYEPGELVVLLTGILNQVIDLQELVANSYRGDGFMSESLLDLIRDLMVKIARYLNILSEALESKTAEHVPF